MIARYTISDKLNALLLRKGTLFRKKVMITADIALVTTLYKITFAWGSILSGSLHFTRLFFHMVKRFADLSIGFLEFRYREFPFE